MADIIRLPVAPRNAAPARIDVQRDVYSVKASSPSDGVFWVRIELPVRDEVVVSDFNPGRLGDDMLISAFLGAVAEMPAGIGTYLFRDVAPGPADPRRGFLISTARIRIERAAERLARQRGRTVHRVSLEEHRGKVNVRVQLS